MSDNILHGLNTKKEKQTSLETVIVYILLCRFSSLLSHQIDSFKYRFFSSETESDPRFVKRGAECLNW